MQRHALGWMRDIRFLLPGMALALFVVHCGSTTALAQFRDVTPGSESESVEKPLTPEPLPASEFSSKDVPVPEAPVLESSIDDADVADVEVIDKETLAAMAAELIAERERALQEEIDNTLVDDTSIRPLPFRGITAGESTREEVLEKWGEPFRELDAGDAGTMKFRLQPFRQVDVTIVDDTVVSLLIHMDGLLAPDLVEEELRMTKLQPTLVRDEMGRSVGLVYPERGVLLGLDTTDPDSLVAKIQLEPVSAEPFVLRAANDRHFQYEANLNDLRTALQMSPDYALGHWMRAKEYRAMGRYHDALLSANKAASLDQEDQRYLLTRIELIAENGDRPTALREVMLMLQQADIKPEIEAAGRALLGHLVACGLDGNYKAAMRHNLDAIDIAAKLVNDPVNEVRKSAKQTLIRSHMSIARNIAMGDFQKQKTVVPKWLNRSRALIDEYVSHERGDRAIYLDFYRQVLATAADIRNPENPSHVVNKLTNESRRLISEADDELRKRTLEWKLGAGLAEAVRLQRQRGRADEALELADESMHLLKGSAKRRQSTPEQTYLIGRLYFHVGSLYAVQQEDHDEAIEWYKKAEPLLADEKPTSLLADAGTHGEMFVSMGVSYWDFGNREKAIDITEFGTDYLQRAVVEGLLDTDVLTIPYGNLATMHMKNGNDREAKAFAELAAEIESRSMTR